MKIVSDKELNKLHKEGKADRVKGQTQREKSKPDAVGQLLNIVKADHGVMKDAARLNRQAISVFLGKLESLKKPVEVKVDIQKEKRPTKWKITPTRDSGGTATSYIVEAIE